MLIAQAYEIYLTDDTFFLAGSMQSSSGLLADRVIFYKHSDANFYSAWPFVVGRVLSQMPQVRLSLMSPRVVFLR
jgi:hypothetical protein